MRIKELIKTIFPTNRKLLIKRSLNKLTLDSYDEVLVVGAGTDPYRKYFKNKKRYICVDIEEHFGITDVLADAHSLPFDDNSFNCVFASELVEHLDSPEKFMNEANRILKPGGIFIITVPFMFHMHSAPHDYWRPTKQALLVLLKSFSKTEVITQGNRLHSILDLITTSTRSIPIFFPLRILNHIIAKIPSYKDSSAPSGFLIVANK